MPKKIFVSYTMRDGQISVETLKNFKSLLQGLFGIETYIDILDNSSYLDPQREVFRNLSDCDMVLVIKSQSHMESEWVAKELSYALETSKPIRYAEITDVIRFLEYSAKAVV